MRRGWVLWFVVGCSPTTPDAVPTVVEDVLGNRWEEERRRAHAGCTQVEVDAETGEELEAITQYDDHGWPVLYTVTRNGLSGSYEVVTTYERVDGRVVSSESVAIDQGYVDEANDYYKNGTYYGRTFPDCDFQSPAVTTTLQYDEAQRPILGERVETAGCYPSTSRELSWTYTVEDGVLVSSVHDESTNVSETTYDRCAMRKTVSDPSQNQDVYQNHYRSSDGCDLDVVEFRTWDREWHYEDLRLVELRDRVDDPDRMTSNVLTYTGCLE